MLAARCRTLARIVGATIGIAVSASPDLQAERLPFHTYTVADGLAHDRVRCVLADSRGFLWFCTADGLSRFDGSRFINYGTEQGLPHPEVAAIVEAGPDEYWVATDGGLVRLRTDAATPDARTIDSARGKVAGPVPLTVYSPGPEAAAHHVLSLRKDRAGRLWIGTEGGLYVLEVPFGEPRFQRVEPSAPTTPFGQVPGLVEGPDGTLWIGTSLGLFRRLPDGRIVRDSTVPAAGEISRLLVDRLGRIWTSSGQGLTLSVPAPSAPSSTAQTASAALPLCRADAHESALPTAPGDACRFETIGDLPAVVRSLWEGSDGHVWIGLSRGLIEFDGARFRLYSEGHGLPHHTVNVVAEDRASNVWIGTDAGGVAKLTRNGFVSFRTTDGLRHGYVTSIAQSRAGRIRAGGGWPVLNELDGERFASGWLNIPGRTDWTRGYDVLEDHTGDLWVGTPGGLLRFPEVRTVAQLGRLRPKAIYSVANGLPADHVAPTFEDSRGDLWMTAYVNSDGSDRRAVRWQRSTGRFQQYPETDTPLVSVRGPAFAEDVVGTVWLGSSRGLSRNWKGRFTNIKIADGQRPIPVTALHVDPRGRLWVGTRGAGLYRLDDLTAEHPRFSAYTVAQGLSSGTVWCLADDGAGHLYIGTARGVDRLGTESGQVKHLSVADGLAGSEVLTAFRARDGALWFGTFTGISRLTVRPDVTHRPPTVWIGGLRIRGAVQPLEMLGQSHVSVRDLAPHQNQIQIDYFGLAPAPGARLTYQYQLGGTESAWTPTPERSVNYAELSPGSYRFLVRAVDEDGRASQSPASVTFTILPPVWTRAWFLGTLVLIAIGSGYVVHNSRMRRLLATERLRTRIASDLHDDVGSSLTQISMLSEIVRTQLANSGDSIADPLSRIGTLSRESVDSMSDIVWAIDPARDTPVHLLQRVRRLAYELLGSADVRLDFTSSGDASPRLSADVRRHVFLMFKEVLNNVVRHAEATVVRIEVTVAVRQLNFVVSDDGCGFDTAGTSDGQGLRSLERRASTLGGVLRVTSSPGKGTRVMFSVPVR